MVVAKGYSLSRSITTARAVAGDLLDWYDRAHRDLPWRVAPGTGEAPDPYRIWLSEVMLQQTTVAAVERYFRRFTSLWPDVHALAGAREEAVMEEWAGLGYYARARNLVRCARVVSIELLGHFPRTEGALIALPGIGPYTAAAIAAIAFGRRAVVVDGNIERVMARMFAETAPLPGAKPALRARADELTPDERPGDYAQAVMDLGATICTPRRPACGICPWRGACAARARGIAEDLPARTPKTQKPVRRGIAWYARDAAGGVLCVRRAPRGLLGGMLALPASGLGDKAADLPPVVADWRPVGEVRHTFTHFHLILEVRRADIAGRQEGYRPAGKASEVMPTLFAKACRLAEAAES